MLLPKAGDEIRNDARAERVREPKSNHASVAIREVDEFAPSLFDCRQRAFDMPQKRQAVSVQLYRAAAMIEECHSHVPLQPGHCAAHGGLRDAKLLSGLADVLRARHDAKILELLEFHADYSCLPRHESCMHPALARTSLTQ